MVRTPSSPVKVTNVVAWSGSVSNHGVTNLNEDDPPPACCHDPAWATPLTVSAVGLSPVQIQTVVPGAASSQSSLTGQPLPAQPSVAPSATPVPGPMMERASIEATANQPRDLAPRGPLRIGDDGRVRMGGSSEAGHVVGGGTGKAKQRPPSARCDIRSVRAS